MKCIKDNGEQCPYLKWNQKGNYSYHCNHNPQRLVQLCDEDLKKNIPCPLDLEKKCQ